RAALSDPRRRRADRHARSTQRSARAGRGRRSRVGVRGDRRRASVPLPHVYASHGAGLLGAPGARGGLGAAPDLRALSKAARGSGGTMSDTELRVEERLGELLIVGFPGTEWTPEIESELRRIRPAGVIFFAANFPDAGTAARLCRAVHATLGSPAEPPLVCADEEGGMVSQLSGFWEVPPSARAVAASGGPPLVKDLAQRTARRLLALGVNLDFAPVLDIHSNPLNPVIGIRSFGTAASQVTACGRAAVEGMEAAGIIPVVKHFPGHGDTSLDSHVDLPRVETEGRLLALRELRPFEAAVAWGAPVVMVAHVVVPALDPDPGRPATLSPPIVTGALRERMGFQGVVVTDALEMVGATSRGSYGEVAVRAIEAGSD